MLRAPIRVGRGIGTGIDGIPPELFHQGPRGTTVGTLVFLADVVLMIVLYTEMRRYFKNVFCSCVPVGAFAGKIEAFSEPNVC